MKIKTADLDKLALDWAVTTIEEPDALRYGVDDWREQRCHKVKHGEFICRWHQSWAQGGPVIEREGIDVIKNGGAWTSLKTATANHPHIRAYGPTPLIAAMRCYVASCLGDEVDVPDELFETV